MRHLLRNLLDRARVIMAPRRLPDFLGIGAQKSGTTWLADNLRLHPQIFLPEQKELHYFDQQFEKPLHHYSRHFARAGARRCGEITPAYGSLPDERVAAIARLVPDIRLILLLRDPIDRAWSQALMELVQRPGRSLQEISDKELIAHFQSDESRKRGNYTRILRNWFNHFPREQLLIRLFESIPTAPEQLLADVFRHIGVSTDVDWSLFPLRVIAHRGVRAPLPAHLRSILVKIYAGQAESLSLLLGPDSPSWTTNRAPIAESR